MQAAAELPSAQRLPVIGRSSPGSTTIAYGTVDDFPGWAAGPELLNALVAHYAPKTVLEVGSGANPTMSIDDVRRCGLHYVTSDIDETELAKADPVYTTRCMDASQGDVPESLLGAFDLVFSRMVNEHVRDGHRYHSNILRMLAPGGVAVHAFSTLYTVPFLVNYLMPVKLSQVLLELVSPRDAHQHGKFPAHYSWSRGPTAGAVQRFRDIGYDVISYTGYFGHEYYLHRSRLLHRLEQAKSRVLLQARWPLLCSYAVVVLRKPS